MTEQQLSQRDGADAPAESAELWRNEVQDRLARYKRRRSRRIEGAFTMRFPFPAEADLDAVPDEPPIASAQFTGEAAPSLPDTDAEVSRIGETESGSSLPMAESSPEEQVAPEEFVLRAPSPPEDQPTTFVDTVPRPRPTRKVIAFPRHLSVAPEVAYRLADPVLAEAPRILDVPEELEAIPATPFLDGLRLETTLPAAVSRQLREHEELPYEPVRVSQRLFAALVDLGVVSAGVVVFAAVAYRLLDYPSMAKPLWLGLGAATAVLWSAYQYLFLVHAGKTPGMMTARLHLCTFKGQAPRKRARQLRVLSFYFSTLSLAMGLMWAFADVDGFCWHDRLSRTFLTRRQ
jgi:uncharacterized RDD family membrane protein YckC